MTVSRKVEITYDTTHHRIGENFESLLLDYAARLWPGSVYNVAMMAGPVIPSPEPLVESR